MFKLKEDNSYSIIKRPKPDFMESIVKLQKRPVEIIPYDIKTKGKSKKYIGDQGKEIIREAKIQAEKIKEDAKKQGQKEGYQAGYREGISEAKNKFKKQISLLEKIKKEFLSYKNKSIKNNKNEIAQLAVTIAKKIIRQKINENESIVIDCINFALKAIDGTEDIRIRLNPKDYKLINSSKEDISKLAQRFESIKFLDDRRVEKGGCIIESENGTIDSRPSSQIKIVERLVNKKIKQKKLS